MGFRTGAWCTVWSVERSPKGTSTKVRLSTSKKNKEGAYEQDFSGFCLFIGQANTNAAKLKAKDRIKLGECEVTSVYDATKKKEYINFKVFSFEPSVGGSSSDSSTGSALNTTALDELPVEEGDGDNLPF